ncbi:parkin co-regulated gene (PACRGB) protein, partial [Trypanosoma cruzi]
WLLSFDQFWCPPSSEALQGALETGIEQKRGGIGKKYIKQARTYKEIEKQHGEAKVMAFSRAERKQLLRDRELLPPLAESPFGPFPPGHGSRSEAKVFKGSVVVPTASKKASATGEKRAGGVGVRGDEATEVENVPTKVIRVGRTGTGGMTFSTFNGTGKASSSQSDGRFGDPKGPGKAGAFKKQKIPPTDFRTHYERGDLPLSIQQAATRSLLWRVKCGYVGLPFLF